MPLNFSLLPRRARENTSNRIENLHRYLKKTLCKRVSDLPLAGLDALKERSSKPTMSPTQITSRTEARTLELRRHHPS
jgi:hypothetical protein